MKTSELVFNFLRSQGFSPVVDPDDGNITFKFQMANFLFINNDEDEEFFQLIMPAIFDVTDDNREIVLETCNKVCTSVKVLKACVFHGDVWLFFEILLDHTPDVEDIIPRALSILQAGRQRFYQEIR